MAIEPEATGLTYEDLQRMFPEEDLVRRELIGGELFVTPSPGYRHQHAVVELTVRLYAHAQEHGGKVLSGPFDVRLSDVDVLEPDVLYLSPRTLERVGERYLPGAPDLVVEVSSPSTRARDLGAKKRLYERHGAREYWFVDLDADRVEIHRSGAGRYPEAPIVHERGEAIDTPLLPGLSISVDAVLGRLGEGEA